MARTGRPKKNIDLEMFKKLCGMQCTLAEIAGFFDCSEDTIERWCKRELKNTFAEVYKIHSASGKITLRRSQFKLAEKSAAMAIWLGKQYLGQKDSIEIEDRESLDRLDEILKSMKTTAEAGKTTPQEPVITSEVVNEP